MHRPAWDPCTAVVTRTSLRVRRLAVALVSGIMALGFTAPALAADPAASPILHERNAFSVDVDSGYFEKPFSVTVSPTAAGVAVYYTTNGARPTPATGTRYTQPIAVSTTTILRYTAIPAIPRDEPAASTNPPPIKTRSYLFLRDVPGQTGAGFPASWGTNDNHPVPADYEMDPEITQHPDYRNALLPGLRTLPALSLVLDPADLFDPQFGIYAHPRETGAAWERPASVELLLPRTRQVLRIQGGIRIQGGWNRRPEESPKHAFRLMFRKKYGPGKWKAPLFEEPGPNEFDELILRAGCNNTWLHWSGEERRRGDFIRDQWMRDTYAAMGHPSARGRFVHLFLNGLYWGLYNLSERPSAPFVASHLGGRPEDFDSRNGENVIEGDTAAWRELIALADAGAADPERYDQISRRLDLTSFADFMLLNLYGANGDWDGSSNWYAARRRRPPGPFLFLVWDGERTLEGLDDNTLAFDAKESPPGLFQQLRQNAAFRRLFAERARLHLTGDGTLTAARAAERFRKRADEIQEAVVAESARWGDYRRDVHPYKTGPYELYTRDGHWRPEINRLLTAYFPKRSEVLIGQLKAADLW